MSVSTFIAVRLNRLAIAVAKHCRNSSLKKIEQQNKEIIRIYDERRKAEELATAKRDAMIEAAMQRAADDKQKARDIAEARQEYSEQKESKLRAELYEIESNCRLS